MTSQTDIVNRALQQIGTRTTVSDSELTDLTSNEAIQAKLVMDSLRDDLLRMAPWDFAAGAAVLSLIFAAPGTPENTSSPTQVWQPGQPLPPWLYEYAYPADCLRVLYLLDTQQGSGGGGGVPITTAVTGIGYSGGTGPAIPFKTQFDKNATGGAARVILTNQQNAVAYYIQRVTDVDSMDSLFQSAWVSALAANLCIALSGDKKLANGLIQAVNTAIMEARLADATEGLTIDDRTPDWIAIRGWGGGGSYSTTTASYSWGGLFPTW